MNSLENVISILCQQSLVHFLVAKSHIDELLMFTTDHFRIRNRNGFFKLKFRASNLDWFRCLPRTSPFWEFHLRDRNFYRSKATDLPVQFLAVIIADHRNRIITNRRPFSRLHCDIYTGTLNITSVCRCLSTISSKFETGASIVETTLSRSSMDRLISSFEEQK